MTERAAPGSAGGPVPMLSVDGLEVTYGSLQAVRGVTFDVRPGEIVVLLGSNGAGKSSILKAVVGLEPIARGSVFLDGIDLGRLPLHKRSLSGLGYLPEGRGVFPNMTVAENVSAALRRGCDRDAIFASIYQIFPVLQARSSQIAGTMSGGEQQMLSLSRALAGEPKLLVLDELSLGLAPAIVAQLFAKVRDLRDTGLSILLVEQFAHAALRVADRAGVIVRGELTSFGPASELTKLDPDELARMYFDVDRTRGRSSTSGTAIPSDGELSAQRG